jgi:aminopeptidase N
VCSSDLPEAAPAERTHSISVARATGGVWTTDRVTIDAAEVPYSPDAEAVVLDPFDESWDVVLPDAETVRALPGLIGSVSDSHLLAGIWNGLRSGFHNAAVDPAAIIDVAVAALPLDDAEDGPRRVRSWLLGRVVPLAPEGSLDRLREAAAMALEAQEAGSERQLSALRTLIATTSDEDVLRGVLTSPPPGIEVDRALRWKLLIRLADLGHSSREELQAAFDADPAADAKVSLTRALCGLPDPAEKARAWSVFTGETDLPNYEVEAAGQGLWRGGQESLTTPYVDRYFDELPVTAQARSGWVLADAAEAFFPATSLASGTLARAEALIADPELAAPLRRRLSDSADALRRQLAVKAAYPQR